MTGGAAGRYARALFDVVLKESDPQRAEQELADIAAIVEGSAQLAQVFANPAIPRTLKSAVMEQLLARVGELSPPVRRLFLLLAERDRLPLLGDLLAAYRTRLMNHLKIVHAEITTAIQLPEERAQAIQQSLTDATGQQVTVSTRVAPSIVGGVVARVGSTVYDGSIVRHLDRMRERMLENA